MGQDKWGKGEKGRGWRIVAGASITPSHRLASIDLSVPVHFVPLIPQRSGKGREGR